MNIGLITPGFSQSADDWAIPALQALAERLARSHHVRVFSLRYPPAGRFAFGGLTHYATGGGTRFGIASLRIWQQTLAAIQRQHRQAPFDVLHAFWADEPGLVAVLAGKRLRLPVVVSLGGGELTYLKEIGYGTAGSGWRRAIVRLALAGATRVTAGSVYQQRLAEQHGVPTRRFALAPLGVDSEHFRPGSIPDWRRPTLVQAASMTPVKDQALLFEVVRLIGEVIPDIRLLLAGDGPLKHVLQDLAARLDIVDSIDWLGNVSYPSMPEVYHQAHLYLQTSRHESQGMAVLEAMACGLPAVGTPVGVLPEVSPLPASWQADLLAHEIIALLRDEARYASYRARARQCVEERFSLNRCVERFLSLYL